jgi:hypothetical protein
MIAGPSLSRPIARIMLQWGGGSRRKGVLLLSNSIADISPGKLNFRKVLEYFEGLKVSVNCLQTLLFQQIIENLTQ